MTTFYQNLTLHYKTCSRISKLKKSVQTDQIKAMCFVAICVLPTMLFSQAFFFFFFFFWGGGHVRDIFAHLTNFCNCVDKNCRQQQYFPSWSLIYGFSWSGLIEADRSRDRTHFGNPLIIVCCFPFRGHIFKTKLYGPFPLLFPQDIAFLLTNDGCSVYKTDPRAISCGETQATSHLICTAALLIA